MPPRIKVTKREIISAAADVVRRSGERALNARNIAARLGTSTQPVFSNYSSMDEVRKELLAYANELYGEYIQRVIASRQYPPYKSAGIAYIVFAHEEKQLFKFLFMRDRNGKEDASGDADGYFDQMPELIQKNIGLSLEQARRFHLEMWIYVHGIATMTATSYLELDMDTVSDTLTDIYQGLILRFKSER